MQERKGALPTAMGWERWAERAGLVVEAPLAAGGVRASAAWAHRGHADLGRGM